MKHLFLSCAYLAALVSAAPPQPASQNTGDANAPPPKTMDDVAPVIKPVKIIDVEPLIRPGAKRQLVRFGPFTLPAAKVQKLPFNSWYRAENHFSLLRRRELDTAMEENQGIQESWAEAVASQTSIQCHCSKET
jgi:hypothetical protein